MVRETEIFLCRCPSVVSPAPRCFFFLVPFLLHEGSSIDERLHTVVGRLQGRKQNREVVALLSTLPWCW